jgi:cytochrome c553
MMKKTGTGVLAIVGSMALLATAVAGGAEPDAGRGEVLYRACTACHGQDGGGRADGTVPRIAGQYPSVLVKQLADFRNRRRWDLRMERVASDHGLSDRRDTADVAAHIARLEPQAPAAVGDGEFLRRGATAYVQACAACHGASGQGNAAKAIPRLAGQHAAYLLRQMQESATQGRPGMTPAHVRVLRTLSYEDFAGAADYLARLAVRPGRITPE